MIVDQHQPVVEKYYGVGKMRLVVERLLQECDRVAKGIIDGWEEERTMKRKVPITTIHSCWANLFMMRQLTDITNNPPIPMFSSANRRPPSSMNPEEAPVDPREIDRILSELAGMIGRWSLFKKFLTESLSVFAHFPHKQKLFLTTLPYLGRLVRRRTPQDPSA